MADTKGDSAGILARTGRGTGRRGCAAETTRSNMGPLDVRALLNERARHSEHKGAVQFGSLDHQRTVATWWSARQEAKLGDSRNYYVLRGARARGEAGMAGALHSATGGPASNRRSC